MRTLVELLADDGKLHGVMRDSLRIAGQMGVSNCDSQKKLATIDRDGLGGFKNVGMGAGGKPVEKKTTLK